MSGVGLGEYFAEVLPQDKAAKVKEVQARGVLLTPALAAVLMSASAVIVAINPRPLRLKNDKPLKNGETVTAPAKTQAGATLAPELAAGTHH